jgi:phosphoribosylamine--glycine ligase
LWFEAQNKPFYFYQPVPSSLTILTIFASPYPFTAMNILLLGSGGREHAIAWKLRQSNLCSKLLIAPGNAGTALCGINKAFKVTDFEAIANCCVEEEINMVIVGPEEPLVKGIVDFLKNNENLKDLLVIGPSKEAAQLEGSKAFAKSFMHRHNIPTANYKEFTASNFGEGIDYLKEHTMPVVLKADGLAAGKGVMICQNTVEAVAEFELIIQRSKFGEAGKRVVVEEFLTGIELSVFVLTDGKDYILLPEAKDYKRVGEGDKGLNTGGMGAISPVPFADASFMQKVTERIIEPTVKGLREEKFDYKGFIFFGLINVDGEPFVIEYNCRMGDPETEVVIPRIKNDLCQLLIDTAEGKLSTTEIITDNKAACTFVAVSGGYPNEYETGFEIKGLDYNAEDVILFHSGTKEDGDKVVTNGGRVVCVTALGESLQDAVRKSRTCLREIQFENMYFRKDIGYEFLR